MFVAYAPDCRFWGAQFCRLAFTHLVVKLAMFVGCIPHFWRLTSRIFVIQMIHVNKWHLLNFPHGCLSPFCCFNCHGWGKTHFPHEFCIQLKPTGVLPPRTSLAVLPPPAARHCFMGEAVPRNWHRYGKSGKPFGKMIYKCWVNSTSNCAFTEGWNRLGGVNEYKSMSVRT